MLRKSGPGSRWSERSQKKLLALFMVLLILLLLLLLLLTLCAIPTAAFPEPMELADSVRCDSGTRTIHRQAPSTEQPADRMLPADTITDDPASHTVGQSIESSAVEVDSNPHPNRPRSTSPELNPDGETDPNLDPNPSAHAAAGPDPAPNRPEAPARDRQPRIDPLPQHHIQSHQPDPDTDVRPASAVPSPGPAPDAGPDSSALVSDPFLQLRRGVCTFTVAPQCLAPALRPQDRLEALEVAVVLRVPAARAHTAIARLVHTGEGHRAPPGGAARRHAPRVTLVCCAVVPWTGPVAVRCTAGGWVVAPQASVPLSVRGPDAGHDTCPGTDAAPPLPHPGPRRESAPDPTPAFELAQPPASDPQPDTGPTSEAIPAIGAAASDCVTVPAPDLSWPVQFAHLGGGAEGEFLGLDPCATWRLELHDPVWGPGMTADVCGGAAHREAGGRVAGVEVLLRGRVLEGAEASGPGGAVRGGTTGPAVGPDAARDGAGAGAAAPHADRGASAVAEGAAAGATGDASAPSASGRPVPSGGIDLHCDARPGGCAPGGPNADAEREPPPGFSPALPPHAPPDSRAQALRSSPSGPVAVQVQLGPQPLELDSARQSLDGALEPQMQDIVDSLYECAVPQWQGHLLYTGQWMSRRACHLWRWLQR